MEKTSKEPEILLDLGLYYKSKNNPNEEKGNLLIKKAYNLIKNQDDSLLKSEIFLFYARILARQNPNGLNFPKLLLIKSKNIIEKYPNNWYYRKNYNSVLFHLANIQKKQGYYEIAISTYLKLLENKSIRKDYVYKANASIGLIYMEKEDFPRAIQYFTNSINFCDDKCFITQYYYLRGLSYLYNENHELGVSDLKKNCQNEKKCLVEEEKSCELLKKISNYLNQK